MMNVNENLRNAGKHVVRTINDLTTIENALMKYIEENGEDNAIQYIETVHSLCGYALETATKVHKILQEEIVRSIDE